MRSQHLKTIIQIAAYVSAFTAISVAIYYLPSYFHLKLATAYGSAVILETLGFQGVVRTVGGGVFLNQVEIVKECTGIQVVAVFAGILLPLPRVGWKVKLQALGVVALSLYVANVIRVVLELWLLYAGILPWSLAHEPFGAVLSVISVALLLLIANHYIPEIGDFLVEAVEAFRSLIARRRIYPKDESVPSNLSGEDRRLRRM